MAGLEQLGASLGTGGIGERNLMIAFYLEGRGKRWNTIYDVGAGYGVNAPYLRPFTNNLAAVDLNDAALQALESKGYNHIYKVDISQPAALINIVTPDDLVIMTEVIEHLTKDQGLALLQGLRGEIILSTPSAFNPNLLPTILYGPEMQHRSLWSKDELAMLGFTVYDVPNIGLMLTGYGSTLMAVRRAAQATKVLTDGVPAH